MGGLVAGLNKDIDSSAPNCLGRGLKPSLAIETPDKIPSQLLTQPINPNFLDYLYFGLPT